jgi:hypothetical protein
MFRTCLASVLALSAVTLVACGSDGGGATPDASVTFVDSGTPDATVPVCEGDVCGGVCIDTSTDPLNCGGCDLACDSPGQICSGALPCACPEAFVPAGIGNSGFDQMTEQQGITLAVAPLIDSVIDAVIIGYDDTVAIGEDVDLSGGVTVPTAAAAYDVNINTQSAHTAYAAISGTVNFTTHCSVGATGTMTNVVFAEVTQALPPEVIEGGCQFTVDTVAFDIGDACP